MYMIHSITLENFNSLLNFNEKFNISLVLWNNEGKNIEIREKCQNLCRIFRKFFNKFQNFYQPIIVFLKWYSCGYFEIKCITLSYPSKRYTNSQIHSRSSKMIKPHKIIRPCKTQWIIKSKQKPKLLLTKNVLLFLFWNSENDKLFHFRWCPRGVMVKAMDCGIVVSVFVFQSRYYVYFRANTLGKGMNPLILPDMG